MLSLIIFVIFLTFCEGNDASSLILILHWR